MKKKIVIIAVASVVVAAIAVRAVIVFSRPTSPAELVLTISHKTSYGIRDVELVTSENPNLYLSGSLKINGVAGSARLHKSSWQAEYRCQLEKLCFTVDEWSVEYWTYEYGEEAGKRNWAKIMEKMSR